MRRRSSFGILAAAMLSGTLSEGANDVVLKDTPKKIYRGSGSFKPLNQRQKRRNKRRVCRY